jgi:hypothetical protein
VGQLPGLLILQGATFLIIFGFIAALTVPAGIAGSQLNAMPVSTVAQLGPSGTAKVFGTVSPGQSTVIVVFSYRDSTGTSQTGRHVEDFWFNDSTGVALIQMGPNSSSSPSIATGGEPYPSVGTPTGFQYESGDPISVIGNVVHSGNETIIQATEVAPAPGAFSHHSDVFDAAFFGIPISVSSAALVAGVFLTRHRLRLHELHVPQWAAKRPKQLASAPPTDSVTWADNPYAGRMRSMGIAALGGFAGLLGTFLVVVLSPIVFPDALYYGVLFGAPIALIFSGVYGLVYLSSSRSSPRRLGVSRSGLYFDFQKPPKNARTFVAWGDVRELEAPLSQNRRAVKLDTPLGAEYVQGLTPEVIAFLRDQFEAARLPYRDSSAPIRPSVASLLGTGAPAVVAETEWAPNPLRPRWMRRGVLLLLLEIPTFAAFLLVFARIGVNQGDALFFFPLIIGAQTLYSGAGAVRAVGISSFGFSLRERKGERTIPWSEIAELTPMSRGLRYKTATGFAEAIGLLDRSVVDAIVDGLNRARGTPSVGVPAPVPPPVGAWRPNPVHRTARALLLLLLVGPAVPIGVSVAWIFLEPFDPIVIFGIGLPGIVMIFALYPAILWRGSPVRIATTSEALFVDYGRTKLDPGRFEMLRFSNIASAMTSGRSAVETATPSGYLGITSTTLTLRTVAGVNLTVGAISPPLARSIAARLRPEQMREWKPPA